MKVSRIEDFQGGWFVGDFSPSILRTNAAEVAVKFFEAGATETEHYQRSAMEITVVVSGECRMGDASLAAGDVVMVEPLVPCDFEALTDVTLVAVKLPSSPDDKVLGRPRL